MRSEIGRMELGERIRAARIKAGLSQAQLAQKIRVSRTAVGQWEDNKTAPKRKHVLALAVALKVPPAVFTYFGGGTVEPIKEGENQSSVVLIQWSELRQIYGGELAMSALMDPEMIETDIPDATAKCVALRIQDASMEPTFQAGEIVIVDYRERPGSDDCVVARLPGGEHVFRHYVPRRSGAFDLVAENPEWETITANSQNPVEIIAVMVEHRRRRRAS
jgi:transcriptional regulator with XRE-family HTH domain